MRLRGPLARPWVVSWTSPSDLYCQRRFLLRHHAEAELEMLRVSLVPEAAATLAMRCDIYK